MYQPPFDLWRNDPALFRLMCAKHTPLARAQRRIRAAYQLLSKGIHFCYCGVDVDTLPHKDLLKLTKVLHDECMRHRLASVERFRSKRYFDPIDGRHFISTPNTYHNPFALNNQGDYDLQAAHRAIDESHKQYPETD